MVDKTKWSEIYKKYSPKMLWVCRRYVNDVSLAEDLMHEGFLAAMQKQNTFSGFGSFEGWLRTIMVNTSLMYLRKSKTNLFVSDIDIPDNVLVLSDMNTTYDSKSKIINTDFSQQELLEVVNAIPEHHKIVFNMYVIDKFSHNEISKTLNITQNTSKSHLLRARKKIQELLLLKADEKEQKKDRRKLFFWFFFTGSYIDSLYAKGFSSLTELPSKPFDINEHIAQQNLPAKITSGYIFGITLQRVTIIIVSIILLSVVLFHFSNEVNKPEINVISDTISGTETNKTQTNTSIRKDSLEANVANRNQQDVNQKTMNEQQRQVHEKITEQQNKTRLKPYHNTKESGLINKKKRGKPNVVVKKVIDTVYVYK